ncbi:UNVERIFIED_CONTAM: hypothetical protein FKN15_036685 [Acipenser sinensis]
MRLKGIRALNYLGDWLICTQSPAEAHMEVVTGHLQWLGLAVNNAKSQLMPSQTASYLGVSLDSRAMLFTLSDGRVQRTATCLVLFQLNRALMVVAFHKLLGLTAAASQTLPQILHMCPLQAWFNSRVFQPVLNRDHPYSVSSLSESTHLWKQPAHLRLSVALGSVTRREVVTTDASSLGSGTVWNCTDAQGSAHRYHLCADSGGAKMNTRCPPKRVPSAARFFTLCRLTVQPPQSYSVVGQ